MQDILIAVVDGLSAPLGGCSRPALRTSSTQSPNQAHRRRHSGAQLPNPPPGSRHGGEEPRPAQRQLGSRLRYHHQADHTPAASRSISSRCRCGCSQYDNAPHERSFNPHRYLSLDADGNFGLEVLRSGSHQWLQSVVGGTKQTAVENIAAASRGFVILTIEERERLATLQVLGRSGRRRSRAPGAPLSEPFAPFSGRS